MEGYLKDHSLKSWTVAVRVDDIDLNGPIFNGSFISPYCKMTGKPVVSVLTVHRTQMIIYEEGLCFLGRQLDLVFITLNTSFLLGC